MSFSSLLRLYGNIRSVLRGRVIHARMILSGYGPDILETNHLIVMYTKCHRIDDARKVFDRMLERSPVSWSALICGYSQMGMAEQSLNLFRLMVSDGFEANEYVYVGVLSACASLGDVRRGKEIHGRIYRTCLDFDRRVCNSLINMYGKCGFLECAKFVFDAILDPDNVSWTSLLSCFSKCGEKLEGLKIFICSWKRGVGINEFTCASVLSSCADLENLELGMQVHALALKCRLEVDNFVMTGLINVYAKCGELDSACQAFFEADQKNLSTWTALIGGYAQRGRGKEAINLFLQLLSMRLKPNERTFSSVLTAVSDAKAVEVGTQLHAAIVKLGFSSFTFVGNAVLDFYSKCGLLDASLRIFKEMGELDVVSWNALIAGHVRSGHCSEAVVVVKDMLLEGCTPNPYTYSSILAICSDVPAIEWGKQTHCRVLKPGYDSNVVVGSALIDMYAKCGRLTDARKVFDSLCTKNLVSWNSMLVGYAQHGFGREALEIYYKMLNHRITPNDITFLGVLSACGHGGLVQEGWHHFNTMITAYGIAPTQDHLASLVNLFARKGQTMQAYEFIKNFHVEPSKVVWRCLLSGCRTHKDVVLGKYAAEKILSIDPDDTSAHIMLSNIYADAEMWDELAITRKIIKEKILKKDTGYSWTELRNKIYTFAASDSMVYQGINLRTLMDGLTSQLLDAGYIQDDLSLVQVEERMSNLK